MELKRKFGTREKFSRKACMNRIFIGTVTWICYLWSVHLSEDLHSLRRLHLWPLSLKNRAPTSSIYCHFDTEADENRICHLKNVCWDRTERTYVYFRGINPGPSPLMAIDGRARRIVIRRYKDDNTEEAVYLPLLEKMCNVPWGTSAISESAVHVHFRTFWPENYGHALIDDVLAIFALKYVFKFHTRDVMILTDRLSVHHDDPDEVLRAQTNLDRLVPLISDAGLHYLDTHPRFSHMNTTERDVPRFTCVTNLLAGHGNLENLNRRPKLAGAWEPFLNESLGHLKVAPALNRSSRHKTQKLMLINKRGRRRIVNIEALSTSVRNRFPNLDVQIINPSEMGFQDQVALAQQADITFSPCGGVSFFNAFLRRGGIAIIVDYWDSRRKASRSMEGHFWKRLTHHQTYRYHVEKHEVVIEPPGNPENPEYMDYRDYGSVVVNIERALNMIEFAVDNYHDDDR